jgi:hypothetical protein
MKILGSGMSIDICIWAVFEGSSYGSNTPLKFHDALYRVIACDNRRITLFHDTADDHTLHACLLNLINSHA